MAAALISMCVKVGLEWKSSLLAGAGWLAQGDLVVLLRSHLRTGWQWGSRIPEVLCSVPVWTQGWQVLGCLCPQWRSVQRVVGVCLEGSCLGSEKHQRQLTSGLRLSAQLLPTCSQVSSRDCRQELVLGAPCSTSLHQGQEPHTSDRAQGVHRVSARLEEP